MAEINLCAEPRTNMTKIVHDYSQSRNPTVYCELSTRLDVETSRKQFSRESKFLAFWQAFITILQPVNSFEWRCYVVHLNSSVDCYSSQFNQAREREREKERERDFRSNANYYVEARNSSMTIGQVCILGQRCRKADAGNHWPEHLSHFLRSFHFHIFVCIFFFLPLPPSSPSWTEAPAVPRLPLKPDFRWKRCPGF